MCLNRQEEQEESDYINALCDFVSENKDDLIEQFLEEQEDLWFIFKKREFDNYLDIIKTESSLKK